MSWWIIRRIECAAPVQAAPHSKKEPLLEQKLIELIEPDTGGDPQGSRCYLRISLRSLAQRLGSISPPTVGRLLKPLGYSLKTNLKRLVGKAEPDRDRQYRFIQRTRALFIRHQQPTISVDAKKSELIGNFKNTGARYCQQADQVNVYDFPSQAKAKAIPYGIYDTQTNHAFVQIGLSAATPQFAVAAIGQWWQQIGSTRYPNSQRLFIEADAGGCNGHRARRWKYELQRFANDTGLAISVCHYPTGASKWNPIEHRLFSQISRNWAGYPLRSLQLMLALIRATTTSKGLVVQAEIDHTIYEKGLKVSDRQMKLINLKRQRLCPHLNYTISPVKSGNN